MSAGQEQVVGYIPSPDSPEDIQSDIWVIMAILLDIKHPKRDDRIPGYVQDLKDYLGVISSYGSEYKKALWDKLGTDKQTQVRKALSRG